MSRRWLVIGQVLSGTVLMVAIWLGGALDTAWTLILAAVACAVQVALDVHWRAKLDIVRSAASKTCKSHFNSTHR
jgi:hypothetical protein